MSHRWGCIRGQVQVLNKKSGAVLQHTRTSCHNQLHNDVLKHRYDRVASLMII